MTDTKPPARTYATLDELAAAAREAAAEMATEHHRHDTDRATRNARHLAAVLADLIGWSPELDDIRTTDAGAGLNLSQGPTRPVLRLTVRAGSTVAHGYVVCSHCRHPVCVGQLEHSTRAPALAVLGAWLDGHYRIRRHKAGDNGETCDGGSITAGPMSHVATYCTTGDDVAFRLEELERYGYSDVRVIASLPHGWLVTARHAGLEPVDEDPF